jgi:hypothetical protein
LPGKLQVASLYSLFLKDKIVSKQAAAFNSASFLNGINIDLRFPRFRQGKVKNRLVFDNNKYNMRVQF